MTPPRESEHESDEPQGPLTRDDLIPRADGSGDIESGARKSSVESLLHRIKQEGEGPWLLVRPYDSGRVGVSVYVPSDMHDGDDGVAMVSGESLEDAARVVLVHLAAGRDGERPPGPVDGCDCRACEDCREIFG